MSAQAPITYPETFPQMKVFISVAEAQEIMLAHATELPAKTIRVVDAVGRTLAEEIRSQDSIPSFDNSAMDGFAVKVSDVPGRLQVIETVQAGAVPKARVEKGTCSRIMTGAPIPKGADSVVQVEKTRLQTDGTVQIDANTVPRANIRPVGQDVRAGDAILQSGVRITPPMVGMLCTVGVGSVAVTQRPRVAIISTGDELVDIDAPLAPAKVRDSNAPGLAAQAVAAGAVVQGTYRARDTTECIEEVLQKALEADLLVISGGVSVGDYDLVKTVLEDMGMRLLFWKVRQRPGKPLAFGLLGNKPVVGLPGNPVSSAICFDQYVRPFLGRMLGKQTVFRERIQASLSAPVSKKQGFHTFVRGIASFGAAKGVRVESAGAQGSNLFTSMVRANCIVHLPEDLDGAPAGTQVELEWLFW